VTFKIPSSTTKRKREEKGVEDKIYWQDKGWIESIESATK
jgi:hypothetical protein